MTNGCTPLLGPVTFKIKQILDISYRCVLTNSWKGGGEVRAVKSLSNIDNSN